MSKEKIKTVKTVGDKLATVNEDFTIHMYDNGYMLEISGRRPAPDDEDSEWGCAKIIVPTVEELCDLIKEVVTIPRDHD